MRMLIAAIRLGVSPSLKGKQKCGYNVIWAEKWIVWLGSAATDRAPSCRWSPQKADVPAHDFFSGWTWVSSRPLRHCFSVKP